MDWRFPAKLIRVIDGDSLEVDLDLGLRVHRIDSMRIMGVDTPEIRSSDPVHKEAGFAVKAVVEKLLKDKDLLVLSEKMDKYGRVLGDVCVQLGVEADVSKFIVLSAFLLEHNLGRPYEGGSRGPWDPEQLTAIIAAANEFLLGGADDA